MHKTKLQRTFEFFKAITFGNLVGGLATFIIAFVIFFVLKNQATNGQQSVFNDALNVSIFLFPVGLMYSLIVISPIAILLKNRKRAFQICGFIAAVVPSLLLIGNGYWDVLALSYGIATMLLFLRLYSTDQP
jgi:uncharacterized membrane protein YsdA (DUF1294 family)